MTPAPSELDPEFIGIMSAHEAGHAAAGSALGVRVEAVYALCANAQNPVTGKITIRYLTKFGGRAKSGLKLKDRLLLIASGTAGEILLNGKSDDQNACQDRKDLEELGYSNYDYCVEHAVYQLRENTVLLLALRDKIRKSMIDLRHCKVTRSGSHIILAKGSEIEKLYRDLGVSLTAESLALETARFSRET